MNGDTDTVHLFRQIAMKMLLCCAYCRGALSLSTFRQGVICIKNTASDLSHFIFDMSKLIFSI